MRWYLRAGMTGCRPSVIPRPVMWHYCRGNHKVPPHYHNQCLTTIAGLGGGGPAVWSTGNIEWMRKTSSHLTLHSLLSLSSQGAWIPFSHPNPLTAELFNLNFHPLEVVSRWRDPQLQVSENYSDLTKWRSTLFKSCWLMSHFIFTIFIMWYLMC